MSPIGKFGIKLGIYSALLLYLVGDLFVWDGFIHGKINSYMRPVKGPDGDNSAIIATVYGEPLTENQLSRRVAELALLRTPPVLDMGNGMILTTEQDKTALTKNAKYDLLAASLLLIKTRFNDLQLPNRNSEAAKAVESVRARFDGNQEAFLSMLHRQKLSNNDLLRRRIHARLKQTEQLYRATAQAAEPTEKELKTYYSLISPQLRTPDLRYVRHIFLATLNKDEAQVKQAAEAIMKQLNAGESFERLAKTHSEDAQSASKGGVLGRINPANALEASGLDLSTLPDNTPTLMKGKWGWHIVSAGPLEQGIIPTYEQARPALKNAARNLRKNQAIGLYMDGLFEEAHLKSRIKLLKK